LIHFSFVLGSKTGSSYLFRITCFVVTNTPVIYKVGL
jgi:hypothetical protein